MEGYALHQAIENGRVAPSLPASPPAHTMAELMLDAEFDQLVESDVMPGSRLSARLTYRSKRQHEGLSSGPAREVVLARFRWL